LAGACTLLPRYVAAEGIDTEHIFGFMIGTDVREVGELEFQSQTPGRFAKSAGRYRAVEQELELEAVPVDNFRVELGSSFAAHDIAGVPDIDDRRQLGWQGSLPISATNFSIATAHRSGSRSPWSRMPIAWTRSRVRRRTTMVRM